MVNSIYKKLIVLITDKQFVKYIIIGASGVILDFAIFSLLITISPINYLIANFIAISIAIINNFLLNAYINFKKTDRLIFRFASFYLVGLLGLGLSQILLMLFVSFGFGEIFAKLLTLPPILIFQFILNKKYSFKSEINYKTSLNIINKFKNNYPLIIINLLFILSSVFFINTLPLTAPHGGPDESTHFKYNVSIIIKEKRLPVSGTDDIAALSECRDNLHGLVPCIYSYQIYPAFNYVVYAISGTILNNIFDTDLIKGARVASLVWGLVFLNFVYLTGLRITRNKYISAAITAILSLIPQVIFISSYVNQDAHSLAISAFLVYALVRLVQDKNRLSLLLFCVSLGGLLPLAKYNYFIYLPFLLCLLLFFIWKKAITKVQTLALGAITLASFTLLSSFWYIRNYILYKDVLGQDYLLAKMSEYHSLGVESPLLSLPTLAHSISLGFFDSLFNSTFFAFGYMNIWLKESVYTSISLVLIAALYMAAYFAVKTKSKYKYRAIGLLLFNILLIIATVFLVYYNSAKYDFQPQGRYLFPILAPLAASLALLYKYNRKQKYVIHILLILLAFVWINSIKLIVDNYLL